MSYKTTDRIERIKREAEQSVRKLTGKNKPSFRPCLSGRQAVRNQTTIILHKLNDKVGFGKHRNKTWEQVIFDDPDYIQWCFDSIKDFFLDEEATKTWRNRMLAKEGEE